MNYFIPFLLSIAALLININLLLRYLSSKNITYVLILSLVLISVLYFTYLSLKYIFFHLYPSTFSSKNISTSNSIKNNEEIFSDFNKDSSEKESLRPLKVLKSSDFRDIAKSIIETSKQLRPLTDSDETKDDFQFSKSSSLKSEKKNLNPTDLKYIFKSFDKLPKQSVLTNLDNIISELGPYDGSARLIISQLPLSKGFTLMDFISGLSLENQILCHGVAEKTSFIPHSGEINSSAIQPITQYLWSKKDDFDQIIFYCKKTREHVIQPIINILNQRVSYEKNMIRNQNLSEELERQQSLS